MASAVKNNKTETNNNEPTHEQKLKQLNQKLEDIKREIQELEPCEIEVVWKRNDNFGTDHLASDEICLIQTLRLPGLDPPDDFYAYTSISMANRKIDRILASEYPPTKIRGWIVQVKSYLSYKKQKRSAYGPFD